MRRLVIYSPFRLSAARQGGSELRVTGYTDNLQRYVRDFIYCGPDKPNSISANHYVHSDISSKWKKLMLVCNVAYEYLHLPMFILRGIINRFSGIKTLARLVSDGELLYIHQDCTLAEYLRIGNHTHYVYDIHGFFDIQREYFALCSGLKRFFMYLYLWQERKALYLCDYINVQSVEMQAYVTERFKPKGRILLAPDGVPADLSVYKSAQPVHRNRPYILFSGSFKPMGGILDLVQTYIHSETLQECADLIIIGDGPAPIVKQVQTLSRKVTNRIILLSPIPHTELVAYMKEAAVIVCPDTQDNEYNHVCPHIKFYDALATGRPVVATDLRVNRHIVGNHKYPVCYFGADALAMEKALLQAMNMPEFIDDGFTQTLTYSYQMNKYWVENKEILLGNE